MVGDKTYGCCACIGASGIAVMPISSVMLKNGGIVINHYMNGTFTAGGVTLEMETKYPYGEKISIKVHTGAPVSFALDLRIPSATVGTATIDGKVATVGSANMDVRSFVLNFEVNAFIYDEKTTQLLEDEFQNDLRYCVEITKEWYHRRKWWFKVHEAVARLVSPML